MTNITKLTVMAAATIAATIALPATAHAGVPPAFQTPSGNIMCWMAHKTAACRIVDYTYNNRVLMLAAGASSPIALPFNDSRPHGVAVDSVGNVYVNDFHAKRVLKLAAGTSSPIVLPFNDLDIPSDVEVDAAGNVYVSDFGTDQVLKLAAGASSPTVLPFNGLDDPSDVAVDPASNVYVLDNGHFRVLKLPVQ
jgi:DNA-binding beta-propeller fold protein YncE